MRNKDKPSEPDLIMDEAAEMNVPEEATGEDETVDWEPLAAPEPAEDPEPDPPQAKKHVTAFSWRGQTRYRCAECQFDSWNESEVYDHYMNNHLPPAPRVTETGLVDAGGDKIVRVEEV